MIAVLLTGGSGASLGGGVFHAFCSFIQCVTELSLSTRHRDAAADDRDVNSVILTWCWRDIMQITAQSTYIDFVGAMCY